MTEAVEQDDNADTVATADDPKRAETGAFAGLGILSGLGAVAAKCGREAMPTDGCQFFYDCKGCETVLRPKPGDCCVLCFYGTALCPAI